MNIDKILTSFCAEIAAKRKQLGISQKQLAEKINTTQPHIATFEAGKQNLSIKTVLLILDALNLEICLSEPNIGS